MARLTDHTFQLAYGPGDARLTDFYIPALTASVRYERMTGYFSSHALAIAAAGVAHLIANGGRMRLLVGAQLSQEDVAAIQAGYGAQAIVAARLADVLPDPDTLAERLRRRLEALAWMVARGTLEIRVVLPKGPGGVPLPAPASHDYFHPKVGIFTDAAGNQVAFNGSVNESSAGWEHNYEYLTVWRSWVSDESRAYVAEQVNRFSRLWEQREPDWISMPVPDAVRRSLLRYTPSAAPARDPLETAPSTVEEAGKKLVVASALDRERVLVRFLRDLPHLVGGSGLGAATAAVEPWPHQRTVARTAADTYPARYLFCDEVGLGKTIEAGLVLRELWLRGIVGRALILAPKSVLRQWQEELYEKFALNVPIYDGKIFHDTWGAVRVPDTANPWNDVSLALASSQLVKRQDRRNDLLEAAHWDLVLVDEAHHARRKDFLDKRTYRPNRLLELLDDLEARTKGLLLLTATPMQVDPIEVWDLLNLLGLSGEWGADGRNFLRFYTELRREDPDWDFVLRMFQAERAAAGGELDQAWVRKAAQKLGPVEWLHLQQVLEDPRSASSFWKLPTHAKAVAVDGIKQTTPLRRLVFRNTRPLLRDYVRRGLLQDRVPHRSPRLEWIEMRDEERRLYDRIQEYISNFYRKYEEKRKGLGFVMTVYRRRLTSSFYAVRCSLERRLAFLRGQAGLGLDDDDLEQEVLTADWDEADLDDRADDYLTEIAYVEDFLHELRMLTGHGSKVEQLLADLSSVFRHRDTVLVFTRYTDTMDFLREQLRQSYGGQVACYSGRGGEWWDGTTWVPITKEELKNEFRLGERIKILLATDAASEGLNLQTCGVLINYDMPWNPMRVEQRIGRVDRIGQRYDHVWIRNYFYSDTVEAKVYQALGDRIHWFEDVVGPLQPILARVGRTIQVAAMAGETERARVLDEEVAGLDAALDALDEQLNVDAWANRADESDPWPAPASLPEIASAILNAPTLGWHFLEHERIPGAYWLALSSDRVAVTFDRGVFDAHPNTLQLLTYGNPLLDRLLALVPDPEDAPDGGNLLRIEMETPLRRVGYYTQDSAGAVQPLTRLADLQGAIDAQGNAEWSESQVAAARVDAQAAAEAEWARIQRGLDQLKRSQRDAMVARAGRLLLDAALVELALGLHPSLFGDGGYPMGFDEKAVLGLRRHGYPWAPLLKLAWDGMPTRRPQPTDPFYVGIQGEPPEYLRRRFAQLAHEAARLVKQLSAMGA
ncbi:MAG: DEAD/DEAH box helicase family protein [Anaerolineae bacterium]|nr:DEAD/DEAH box helicase family protein [Anaerolineae bacterium]